MDIENAASPEHKATARLIGVKLFFSTMLQSVLSFLLLSPFFFFSFIFNVKLTSLKIMQKIYTAYYIPHNPPT